MKKIFTLFIALTICFLASAQNISEEFDTESEKAAVKNLVEQFLTAIGDHDREKVQTIFSDKANIYGASLRDGKWITNTYTIQENIERILCFSAN